MSDKHVIGKPKPISNSAVRARLGTDIDLFYVECSCGWKSLPFAKEGGAINHGRLHKESAR